ncbi:MAG TPA: hypothetical protein PLU81_05755 [Deltaproteobacteria bacterium]|nr:hypothetical protein [Deltaproteobacteria bacterium]HPJ93117.1 hypothetical protein [Deltaproteobacteria bacterium]HPR51272.1 hypothetical protein [Deltaproteobacteria bacterium]
MAEIKPLFDEYGIILMAQKKLPDDTLRMAFFEALAELEDNECHRKRSFPKTRLHRVTGVKEAVYRADITKVSGWRIHLQYIDDRLHLKDLIEGSRHDDTLKVIKSKKDRYE